MWQSTKTITRNIRGLQANMRKSFEKNEQRCMQASEDVKDSISDMKNEILKQEVTTERYQKDCMDILNLIVSAIGKMQTDTNGYISELTLQISSLKEEIGNTNQKIDEINNRLSNIESKFESMDQTLTASNQEIRREFKNSRELVEETSKGLNKNIKEIDKKLAKCTDKVVCTDKKLETFSKDVTENLSLLDEGTRLIIANMLLNEMGDN